MYDNIFLTILTDYNKHLDQIDFSIFIELISDFCLYLYHKIY